MRKIRKCITYMNWYGNHLGLNTNYGLSFHPTHPKFLLVCSPIFHLLQKIRGFKSRVGINGARTVKWKKRPKNFWTKFRNSGDSVRPNKENKECDINRLSISWYCILITLVTKDIYEHLHYKMRVNVVFTLI